MLVEALKVFLLGGIFLRLAHGLHVELVRNHRHGVGQLHVGEVLAHAADRADAEGLEGALGEVNGLLAVVHFAAGEPALGLELVRVRVVFGVVVDGVDGDTAVVALGDDLSLDVDAAFGNFTPEGTTDGGRHAHGLVDAGAEVFAGLELLAAADLVSVGEGAADFFAGLLVCFRVATKVVEYASHAGGDSVRACDDQEGGLAPQLIHVEAFAGFWVLSLEDVREEILSLVVHVHSVNCHFLADGNILISDSSYGRSEDSVNLPDSESGHLEADSDAESGDLDQINDESVVWVVKHVEGLAENEFSHEIERDVAAHSGDVGIWGPCSRLCISDFLAISTTGAKAVDESLHVAEDMIFEFPQSRF